MALLLLLFPWLIGSPPSPKPPIAFYALQVEWQMENDFCWEATRQSQIPQAMEHADKQLIVIHKMLSDVKNELKLSTSQ